MVTPLEAHHLGGEAGAFLRLGLGADRVGMGDCGAALVGSGTGWYYNPALLPYQTDRQASLGYRWMSLDRSIMYAGFSTPVKPNAGLAVGVMRAGTGDIDARDSNGERFDILSHSENLIHGTFALLPHPQLALGISIKWMINAIPDILDDERNLYAYGMGVDLGMLFRAGEQLRFGLQARDLNAGYRWETSEVWGDEAAAKVDHFPNLMRAGFAWDPISDLTVAVDAVIDPSRVDEDGEAVEERLGAEFRYEFSPSRWIALRAGWNGDVPTFGLGLDVDIRVARARMDYAFLIEQVAPGGSHLIGWVFEL